MLSSPRFFDCQMVGFHVEIPIISSISISFKCDFTLFSIRISLICVHIIQMQIF